MTSVYVLKSHLDNFASVEVNCAAFSMRLDIDVGRNRTGYTTMFVGHTDKRLVSENYATRELCDIGNLKFASRNSPAFLLGTIYLQGAFPEFNHKPYVGFTKHLFYRYGNVHAKDLINSLVVDLTEAATILDSKVRAGNV